MLCPYFTVIILSPSSSAIKSAPPAEVEAASAACPADAPPGSCPPAASLLASAHPDAALPAARQEVRSCHCPTGRTALVRHSKTVHTYSALLPSPQVAEAVLLALERSAETAYDDLCRQLAFRAASDDVSFDVVVLAYSLISLRWTLRTSWDV